jgi:hypothetical protein
LPKIDYIYTLKLKLKHIVIMKKLVSILAVALGLSLSAQAQGSLLGGLLGGDGSTLGNVLSGLAGVVYSAPVTLDGTYTYNGVAINAASSEGGLLTNLAGSAVTGGLESKADEYLAKVGIKPGSMTFVFNKEDNTFTMNIGSLKLPGTYRVGDGERTVTLTFGKSLQFLSMTGTLESSLSGARMLFTADKLMALIKKVAGKLGTSSGQLGSIAKLAEGYDSFKIGFKLTK